MEIYKEQNNEKLNPEILSLIFYFTSTFNNISFNEIK